MRRDADMRRMGVRRGPVLWTLLAIGAVLAVVLAVRVSQTRPLTSADAVRKGAAQAAAKYGTAFRDLNRLTPPAGMTDCNAAAAPTPTVLLCWHSAADAESTAPIIAEQLRGVGATDLTTRCRTFGPSGSQLTQCHADAQLDGHPVAALVVDGVGAPTQATISLDTGLVADPAVG